MVLTHPFHCPVRCVEGQSFDTALAALVDRRKFAIVTSAGWRRRGAVETIEAACGPATAVIDDVESNPQVGAVLSAAPRLIDAEVVVAIGGGSAIDASKGMVAVNAIQGDADTLLDHLRNGTAFSGDFRPAPIVAVPTTSGTGAEVTQWGTLWGEDGTKYSIKDLRLYPSHAVIDPELTRSMPSGLTLSTGLDALSHAMEAVWNRRHSPLTDMLAGQAIEVILDSLPIVLKEPANAEHRRRMQSASLFAGLAMGTTQSALAHSISYPITAKYGVPHGLACSFTLGEIARYNAAENPERLTPIAQSFGCPVGDVADRINAFLRDVGVGPALDTQIAPDAVEAFGDDLITPSRAANNIRNADGPAARMLLGNALNTFCTAS